MTENGKNGLRVPVAWAVIVSLASALVTWGVNANRLETLEARAEKAETLLATHDRQLAQQAAQYAEILRRLDSIDRKIERREEQ